MVKNIINILNKVICRHFVIILFLSISAVFLDSNHAFAFEDEKIIRIYIDADRTGTKESGISIEQGIRVALSEVDNKLDGRLVELVIKNHRGNSRRSKKHLDQFLQDDKALVAFAGLHSPPLLAYRDFINENHIPVLVPWAAAGPITRYPSGSNWIFRLSVDDTKAGYVIVNHAVKKRGFLRPALLLENTGWGKSNRKIMTDALSKEDKNISQVIWFNWGISNAGAVEKLKNILASGADSILFVGNAPEGKTFVKAMLSLPHKQRLPIFSHWGITGGDFPSVINTEMRKGLDLSFIQTRFSFLDEPLKDIGKEVLKKAQQIFPDTIKSAKDIKAPAGFIHAYDLTRLLIAAVEQVGLTGDMEVDRANLKKTLENLETPVKGLIKTYQRPFRTFKSQYSDAHEALSIDDFVMAHYGESNEIVLHK